MENKQILRNIKKNYDEKGEAVIVSLSGNAISELCMPDCCAIMYQTRSNHIVIEPEVDFVVRIRNAKKTLGYTGSENLNALRPIERENVFKEADFQAIISMIETEEKLSRVIDTVRLNNDFGQMIEGLTNIVEENPSLTFTKSNK